MLPPRPGWTGGGLSDMTVILRGRHAGLELDYEIENVSAMGAVTELVHLTDELATMSAGGGSTLPSTTPAIEPVAPATAAVEPPERPAPPKTAIAKSGAVCLQCETPLSASEERASRLFVSKPLCKKCLQSI